MAKLLMFLKSGLLAMISGAMGYSCAGAQVIGYQLGNNITLGVTMYGFTNQMSWLVD